MRIEDTGLSMLLAAGRLPGAGAAGRVPGLGRLGQQALTEHFVALTGLVRAGRPARAHTLFGSFLVPATGADLRGLLTAAIAAEALGDADELDAAGRRHRLPECAPAPEPPREFADRIAIAAEQAADGLRGEVTLGWSAAVRRLARHLVLDAADDTLLDRLAVESGTARADERREDRRAALDRRILLHLELLKPDCFAAMTGATPESPVAVAGLAHLLTAAVVTAETVGPRALALLAADGHTDRAHVEAAVHRATVLWPDLFAVAQRVARPFEWNDMEIEAGTEVLALSSVLRRGMDAASQNTDSDADSLYGADDSGDGDRSNGSRNADSLFGADQSVGADRSNGSHGSDSLFGATGHGPGSSVEAEQPWQLSSLCASPRRCATRAIALDITTEFLVALLADGRPHLLAPHLNPARPPVRLDPRRVRVDVAAFGAPPRLEGLEATAAELEGHAAHLRDLASDTRWDHADGLRTRGVLLEHARRCEVAAHDVRRTARPTP